MKVIVTGAAGFIASHLCQNLLKAGHIVYMADLSEPNQNDKDWHNLVAHPNAKFLKIDCLDSAQLEKLDDDFTHIVHFAALLGVEYVLKNPKKTLAHNVELTINVAELAERQRCLQKFVFASTSEVYAGTEIAGELNFPTVEQSKIILPDTSLPRTSYMLSKVYGEAIVQSLGLPHLIIRPHNIYGPRMGERHVIPQLLRKIHENISGEIEVFSMDHSRTFCFADDAAEMIEKLMFSKNVIGETVNIGSERPEIQIGELANLLMGIVGKKLNVVGLPPTEGSPTRRVPDMKKCYSLCNFSSHTPLELGLKKTYAWYRDNVF